MKLKRFLTLLFAALLILPAGCVKTTPAETSALSPEPGLVSFAEPVLTDGEEGTETTGDEPTGGTVPPQFVTPYDADFRDDVIFLASGDRIETYQNGVRADFAAVPAEKLCVSGSTVCVWGGGVYRELSLDGAEILSYPIEEAVDRMCVTERYAVFAVPEKTGHRLVRLERKSGKIEEVPQNYQPYGDRFVVKSLAGRDSGDDFAVLVWSDAESMNARFGSFAASVDAKSGKFNLRYDFADDPASCASLNAADPSDEAIYLLSASSVPVGEVWYHTLFRYDGKTKDEVAYVAGTEDPAYPGRGFITGFDRLTLRGRAACLFSLRAGAVQTETLPDLSNSLKILCDDLRIDARMKALVIRLAKEYDTGVVSEVLPRYLMVAELSD